MKEKPEHPSEKVLTDWLASCTRGKKLSRNTISVGVVVLDHISRRGTVKREEVISPGGEIVGARSSLGGILESHGIPRTFLKEATGRQAGPDGQRLFEGLKWGAILDDLTEARRPDVLQKLFETLRLRAEEWLNRQNLTVEIDQRHSPATWVNIIIESAKGHSGGVVEQHLVGAKLSKRFPEQAVANHPAHAADAQTDRPGDFTVKNLVYHVTAAPSRAVIAKCSSNIRAGLSPILLVPRSEEEKARFYANDGGVEKELTVIAIEDFVAINIIEMATVEGKDFFAILKEIVRIYNDRLAEVETDLSLKIDFG